MSALKDVATETVRTFLVWSFLISVLAGVDDAEIVGAFDPLCMTIAKVHAGAGCAMIVLFVGPVVVRAAKTAAGIVAIKEEENSGSAWTHSNCFCVFCNEL